VLRGDGRVPVERRVLYGDVHRRAVCPELTQVLPNAGPGPMRSVYGEVLWAR
jgi:hypothetical protein